MRRKREPIAEAGSLSQVPERLRRFRPDEWQVDGQPPPHWKTDSESVGLWFGIRAHQQWMQARREWEAETGVHIVRSWEEYRRRRVDSASSLAEFNEPYAEDVFVDGDELDPRWVVGTTREGNGDGPR